MNTSSLAAVHGTEEKCSSIIIDTSLHYHIVEFGRTGRFELAKGGFAFESAVLGVADEKWKVSEIEAWAHRVKLSDEMVATPAGDRVDGPALVTLQQEELRSKLRILSLPARQHL